MELTGHRKFLVTVLAMLLASLLLAFKLITPEIWASVMQWTACVFIGAQAAQNAGVSITTKGATNG
jgi:membrane-bound metal-dependent hydrolase YbcI (DUF457 family)